MEQNQTESGMLASTFRQSPRICGSPYVPRSSLIRSAHTEPALEVPLASDCLRQALLPCLLPHPEFLDLHHVYGMPQTDPVRSSLQSPRPCYKAA